MQPTISLIICTHNPRQDYLDEVLQALRLQSLSAERWELLLVDNASDQLLSKEIDLTWHPNSRHVREEQLGLTVARLRGIKESKGEILIFVDDDNVLTSDYLEATLNIAEKWDRIGVWGGQVLPSFETEPPAWTRTYWSNLAIREFDRDRWSNLPNHGEALPCGAGLCVRRAVAEKYAELVQSQPQKKGLDRKGNLLTSGGDTDIALTACDLGLGMGQFTALKLTHLIPAQRLQEEYLLRLEEGMSYSGTILKFLRGESPTLSWRRNLLMFCKRYFLDRRTRRFHDAAQRGLKLALEEISK